MLSVRHVLFITLYCGIGVRAQAEVTYVAAVIEYEPYNQWTDAEKGYGVVRQNALAFKDFAEEAKAQSADIMVTPEYGLQSLNMHETQPDEFLTYTQYVPDPKDKITPYALSFNDTNFEAMQILSRTAMENSMYLVIDLGEVYPCAEDTVTLAPWPLQPSANCSASGFFFYNTQAVFDRNGTVIARYRKQNLYGEDHYTPGPQDDSTALFLTDFDVLFTLQICFDIEFEHPAYNNVITLGIKDVAMSNAWVDSLPFDLADNSQNSWSIGLGVNLLVSGHHKPEKGKLGSGIFKGYLQEPPEYVYDKDSGNVLLVSQVRTMAASSNVLRDSKEQGLYDQDRDSKEQGLYDQHRDLKEQGLYDQDRDSKEKGLYDQDRDSKEKGLYDQDRDSKEQDLSDQDRLSFSYVNEDVNKTVSEDTKRLQHIIHADLSNYTSVVLNRGQADDIFSTYACSYNGFCCNLTYEYSGNLTYMFLAYSGQFITTSDYPVGIQICSIVWCKSDNVESCAMVETGLPGDDNFGPFTIFSSSFAMESIFPGGNHRNFSIIDNNLLQFDVTNKNFTLSSIEPIANHLMVALYGKWYGNNGQLN